MRDVAHCAPGPSQDLGETFEACCPQVWQGQEGDPNTLICLCVDSTDETCSKPLPPAQGQLWAGKIAFATTVDVPAPAVAPRHSSNRLGRSTIEAPSCHTKTLPVHSNSEVPALPGRI